MFPSHDQLTEINTTSFDSVKDNGRNGWEFARQIIDQKPTTDYLIQLLKQSMLGLVPDGDGKRKLVDWLNTTTAVATHDDSVILEGSLSSVQKGAISRMYNDFTFEYNYSTSTKNFKNLIRITKADQSTFPDETTYVNETSVTYNRICTFASIGGYLHGSRLCNVPGATTVNIGDVMSWSSIATLADFEGSIFFIEDLADGTKNLWANRTSIFSISGEDRTNPGGS